MSACVKTASNIRTNTADYDTEIYDETVDNENDEKL